MPPGVVAASAGNHAQGVAKAARGLGIRTTVFMPVGAPLPKLAATRAYGAEVVTIGSTIDDALVAATEFSERTGAVLIHPFDHEDIVVGQGTIGLEILEQVPDVRTVLVCTGRRRAGGRDRHGHGRAGARGAGDRRAGRQRRRLSRRRWPRDIPSRSSG